MKLVVIVYGGHKGDDMHCMYDVLKIYAVLTAHCPVVEAMRSRLGLVKQILAGCQGGRWLGLCGSGLRGMHKSRSERLAGAAGRLAWPLCRRGLAGP